MPRPVFKNRKDAGRQLAARLTEYADRRVVVLAIPNGGVPVAAEVARALNADFDVVISRKIPMPLLPESGFGAITDDGTMLLNDDLVRRTGLDERQIELEANEVRAEVRRRSLLYRGDRPCASLYGKTVIIVDDGLASGVTMLAAVRSARQRSPRDIVVAVPCASLSARDELEKAADKVIVCQLGESGSRFTVSDYYDYWVDVKDAEVVRTLDELQTRGFHPAHP